MYDLSVKNHTATWQPRELLTATEVASYVVDALNMLGRRVPGFILSAEFVSELDSRGEFRDTVDDVEIAVWRTP